jgi:queuine tRNA-ribosyltransferase
MPVGTQATLKGLTFQQVADIGYRLVLANTYHLALRPGPDIIKEMGGIQQFMNWPYNVLTDSGGFQMVSLFELSQVVEEGVYFQSPVDGTTMLLKPETSIQIQNKIGSDIMMALDDVIASTTTGDRVREANERTLRWIDRCKLAHERPKEQNLFGIVQGGLDPELRDICLDGMIERDLPGYAIGGLAGGEDKNLFWRVVHQCTSRLPWDKPRYLMGVGYPLDLVVCTVLGVDMFDCVYPCRTARFGSALVPEGVLKLKSSVFAADLSPIQEDCPCIACRNYTRAYLHTVVGKEPAACSLLTIHNLTYLFNLMKALRQSIVHGTVPDFVKNFFTKMFPDGEYPKWTIDALNEVGIKL